jgi:hypothetical protein
MMEVGVNFFKNIYSDDIIYHYTKASTAIDFILHNNQLRFNKARASIDPIESIKAKRRTLSFETSVDDLNGKEFDNEISSLYDFVDNLEDRFNLICFCQNHMGEDFASKNFTSQFQGNEEIFGFTKLRMWDQYADKFAGVCIAFSKSKILSKNKSSLDLIEGNVEYLSFEKLYCGKVGDFQVDHLKNVGRERYIEQLETMIKKSFFYKHNDYNGENEYRIGTLFDESKCAVELVQGDIVTDRNIMLDISGCIEAIFVSSYANLKQKSELLEYADNLNVKIIEMDWQHNSFKANDYGEWIRLVEK